MKAHQDTMKDSLLSAQKVLQFEADNPVVCKGKKRGTFDHIAFYERHSKKSYSKSEMWGQYIDFIEYSRKMERKRGWTMGRSKAKWDFWLAQPGIERDNKGEEKGFELRLCIPKGDYAIVGTASEEEKSLEVHAKKAKGMTQERYKQLQDALGAGHGGTASSFHSGPGAGTAAAALGFSAGMEFARPCQEPGLLEQARAQEPTMPAKVPASGSGAAKNVATTGPGQEQQQQPIQASDVVNARLPALHKFERQAQATKLKYCSEYVAGHLLLKSDRHLRRATLAACVGAWRW